MKDKDEDEDEGDKEDKEDEVDEDMDEDVQGELDEDPTKSEFFSSELMFLISDAHSSDQLLQILRVDIPM